MIKGVRNKTHLAEIFEHIVASEMCFPKQVLHLFFQIYTQHNTSKFQILLHFSTSTEELISLFTNNAISFASNKY